MGKNHKKFQKWDGYFFLSPSSGNRQNPSQVTVLPIHLNSNDV
jgi:hypothetical protein